MSTGEKVAAWGIGILVVLGVLFYFGQGTQQSQPQQQYPYQQQQYQQQYQQNQREEQQRQARKDLQDAEDARKRAFDKVMEPSCNYNGNCAH